jgi:hypothetical protein
MSITLAESEIQRIEQVARQLSLIERLLVNIQRDEQCEIRSADLLAFMSPQVDALNTVLQAIEAGHELMRLDGTMNAADWYYALSFAAGVTRSLPPPVVTAISNKLAAAARTDPEMGALLPVWAQVVARQPDADQAGAA